MGAADDLQVLMELEFHVFEDVNYATDFAHSYYRLQSAEGIGPDYYDLPRFNIHRGYHRPYPDDRYFDLRNKIARNMTEVGIPVKYHHHEVATYSRREHFSPVERLPPNPDRNRTIWLKVAPERLRMKFRIALCVSAVGPIQ